MRWRSTASSRRGSSSGRACSTRWRARRSGIAAALPTTLLVVALVEQRDRSLSEIVSGQPLFYAVLLALIIVGIKYRERERAWLDRRFFRQEYDARAVLLSLSGRIPVRDRPQRADGAGRPADRRGAASDDGRGAGGGGGAGHAGAGVGAARHRRHARRARRHRHDADVVGHATGPGPGRRAFGGRPAAARRGRVAAVHGRGAVCAAVGQRGRNHGAAGCAGAGREAVGRTRTGPTIARCCRRLRRRSAWASTSRGFGAVRPLAADGALADGDADQPAGGRRGPARGWSPSARSCGTCHEPDVVDVRQGRDGAQARAAAAHRGHEVPRGSRAGPRRHGRGVLRARHAARARRRYQGRPRRAAGRPGRPHAVSPRGATGGASAAPGHRRRSSTTARWPTAPRFW